MNWKTIEQVAMNTNKQWYLNQKQVAVLLGCCRQQAAEFLTTQSVPYYRIGKEKSYFLSEVIEAVERTRWASEHNPRVHQES